MSWNYKHGEIINESSQFPLNTFGFVYKVTHIPSGKSYIGKKVLIHNRKIKLTKKDLALYENSKGRKPSYKRISKESDWKTYWGSNKTLLELIKTEPSENFTRQIIKCAPTKKLLTYFETKYLFIYEVLEKPTEFFNDNCLGKFFTKDFI
tara:strand:- start:4301 stop:4750 length:450 start_codon:yes stop_codon:yes gene_type:complete